MLPQGLVRKQMSPGITPGFVRIWLDPDVSFLEPLILKMKIYGFTENALKLITSYLSNREQCVQKM